MERLAQALWRRGHQVEVITYHIADDAQVFEFPVHRIFGQPVYWRMPAGPNLRKLAVYDPALAWKLWRVLAKGKFDVVHAHHVEGLLTVHHVKDIPREKWSQLRVIEAMAPEDCCEKVADDSGLWDALEKMDRSGFNQLLVSRDDEVVGMLNRGDVITFLRTVQELQT